MGRARYVWLVLASAAAALPVKAADPARVPEVGLVPETASSAGAGAAVEVRMKEVEIKGEVERPGVFYIIPRREVEMDLGRQTRDYTPELARPLDPAAFERWVHLQQPAR